ncbi:MAG: methyltransferase domain-containing protein, partial [Verrucomicrobiaceae bacterium]|nr:methyltransferase domain-containing protein [Verrucomicrobiaceae bacterium]
MLTPEQPVSMGDAWFEIATPDHFWIRRRFEVLRAFAGGLIKNASCMAEVGCGNGLLQKQIEDAFAANVDGYDLNLAAMRQSVARSSARHCYDIFQRHPELLGKHDLMFLFDVIEHIDDDAAFLACAAEHVRPGGSLLINVPALQGCYSDYDRAVGHVRRYDHHSLDDAAKRAGLTMQRHCYWGMPLLPLLWWRAKTIRGRTADEIIQKGMKPPGALANRLLMLFSRLEPCPQTIVGTSLMAVLSRA